MEQDGGSKKRKSSKRELSGGRSEEKTSEQAIPIGHSTLALVFIWESDLGRAETGRSSYRSCFFLFCFFSQPTQNGSHHFFYYYHFVLLDLLSQNRIIIFLWHCWWKSFWGLSLVSQHWTGVQERGSSILGLVFFRMGSQMDSSERTELTFVCTLYSSFYRGKGTGQHLGILFRHGSCLLMSKRTGWGRGVEWLYFFSPHGGGVSMFFRLSIWADEIFFFSNKIPKWTALPWMLRPSSIDH